MKSLCNQPSYRNKRTANITKFFPVKYNKWNSGETRKVKIKFAQSKCQMYEKEEKESAGEESFRTNFQFVHVDFSFNFFFFFSFCHSISFFFLFFYLLQWVSIFIFARSSFVVYLLIFYFHLVSFAWISMGNISLLFAHHVA